MGREHQLQQLQQLLQKNNQVAIAAIAGMGGLGKTELALQYAINHLETYKGGICWLEAETEDVGVQVLRFAATHLDLNPPEEKDFDIQTKVKYCFRNWPEGDVLLVVDDVTDYKQVKTYLNSLSPRFKVLMTTRQKFGASIKELPLNVLPPDAALEMLRSLLGETAQRIEKELDVANQLCEWLGYLPLGLELVGRYLARKQDLSISEMTERLKNKRLDQPALSKSKSDPDMTAQRGVKAAFELSWLELTEDDRQLGCLLSLFAAAPILWELVEQSLPKKSPEDLEDIRDNKLLTLHLLQRETQGIYKLHPLLREFFQSKLTDLEQTEKFKRSLSQVMVTVARKIPSTPTREDINAVSLKIPHLAEVAKHFIPYIRDEDLIYPFIGLGGFYGVVA
ncbi:NB-ARC domain-containing protein [Anabaena sp. CS-542/02]|uniref:NB-ARC domain-containing protein n=1 Tax=Anabaena sp. CS-542/02 TaxID=3021719 RepID=UPI00232D3B18|nr:NB-ARC domain-containing protein [Anabaena sp. CS-542/02]MDB9446027.1 NB-ARC domain-containing protein [Anabaena sp. CS-542/02]